MTIYEIAEALAEKFHLEKLECENGTLEIKIDDIPITIDATSDNAFILSGLVGDIPLDGESVFDKVLLENNNIMMNSRPIACARNSKSNTYVLIEHVPVRDVHDFEIFCEYLEKFVNTLESTRSNLQDLTFAQSQGKTQSSKEEYPQYAFSAGDLRA